MSIPGALAFSIYVEWFNAHGKSTQLASIGPIMLICLNLPPSERLKPENVYVAGIIPGPKEPTSLQLNCLLMPLIMELKELWQGYHFSPTSTGPLGSFIRVAILMTIADVVAMRKLTGFISPSGSHFFNFCTIHNAQIEEISPQFHYTRSYQNNESAIVKWLWASPQQRQAILSEYGVQYSILEDLPYWDATRMVNLDILHNLILVILKDHEAFQLCIPEFKSKIYFRSCRKSNETNNIPSFNADYITTSEIPSELDISALSDHQIKVPRKMGSPSHCSLKAYEWALLYKVYIPFLILSKQMSLDEHNSPNTQRKMGQAEELANELTKNTFHLISAINIATSWTVSMDDTTAFAEHCKKNFLSNQHLFPKQKSKPNHHLVDHIPELFQCWGPEQASATWVYEIFIGVFAKMPTNNKICM
ncbi:hypothetical protein O181_090834 [Austropuccinia psidii MF-1]|uniref:Uncharacterized protein n=1 Tax=Austropuccinia psidii MF-1 TaxID=1389203 RepID=A0A9Q3P7B0_9BASI|nr:hypothetical protein [Austropuccinia psidii MF-1]